MKITLLACTASFLLFTQLAAAQSAYPGQPMAAPATPVSPPPGVLSTERHVQAVDAYGNRYDKTQTTYRNSDGVAQDTTTTRTIVTPPPPVTRSSTTTTTTTTAPQ
jgi:hypothetical protein